jgi:arylsulfatase A-like enzyme
LRGYKSDAWEGGHRVPFIVRWPKVIKAGTVCDQLVSQADITATAAELAGAPLPENAGEDSFSMVPLLKGGKGSIRENAVSTSLSGLPAVRFNQWLYIPASGSGGWGKGGDHSQPVQLYNLADDIGETTNLAAQQPKRVVQMQTLLEKLIIQGRSTPGPVQKNDVEVRRYLPKDEGL